MVAAQEKEIWPLAIHASSQRDDDDLDHFERPVERARRMLLRPRLASSPTGAAKASCRSASARREDSASSPENTNK
jgi:hypothetical protein